MRKFLLTGSALALVVSAAAAQVNPAPGQPVPQPAQPVPVQPGQPQPAQAVNAWRTKSLLGSKVFVQNNTGVGIVDDIVFDNNGTVEYVIVQNEGKLTTVPWDAVKFDNQQQLATVNVTPQQWQAVPTYTTTTYPSFFTPQYRTTTYKAFNLTPGQLRRLERRIDR